MKRYKIFIKPEETWWSCDAGCHIVAMESPDGNWVSFTDYEALRAERNALKERCEKAEARVRELEKEGDAAIQIAEDAVTALKEEKAWTEEMEQRLKRLEALEAQGLCDARVIEATYKVQSDLKAENARLREALGFYASPDNWRLVPEETNDNDFNTIVDDSGDMPPSGCEVYPGKCGGRRARAALEGK